MATELSPSLKVQVALANKRQKTYSKKKPPGKSKKVLEREEYDAWLKKHQVGPKTRAKREPLVYKLTVPERNKGLKIQSHPYVPNQDGCAVRSMTDELFLSRESPEVADEIRRKSKQVSIEYNKGGYTYITETSDPKTFGRK